MDTVKEPHSLETWRALAEADPEGTFNKLVKFLDLEFSTAGTILADCEGSHRTASEYLLEKYKEKFEPKGSWDAHSDIVHRYSKEPIPYIPPKPQKKTDFSWLWVTVICAGIWGLSLLTPGETDTFLGGVASLLVSLFVLFNTYITGNIKLTFRAGCYIWLIFFAGIGFTLSGIGEMFSPTSTTPTPTIIPTKTPLPSALTKMGVPTETLCYLWSEVTPKMKGQNVCVYGTITSLREYYGASQIRFGSDSDFFLSSGTIYYPDAKPEACVYAEGVILLSSEQVPYIQVDKNPVYICESWMK